MSLTRPNLFLKKVTKEYNKSFPLQLQAQSKRSTLKQPWMTPGLLKSARRQEQLHFKFIKDPTEENKTKFTAYRNKNKSLRRKEEENYYIAEFSNAMTNIKKTWQTIKSIIRIENKDNSIKAINVKGQNISDPLKIADSFNSYFTGIVESLSKNIPNAEKTFGDYMPSSVLDSIALLPTCLQELMTISRSLKETVSSGVDELNPHAITAAIDLLVAPL